MIRKVDNWYLIRRPGHRLYDRICRDEIQMLVADADLAGLECEACLLPIEEHELLVAIPLGPGGDPEQRRRCSDGQPYDAQPVLVHWACATGQTGVGR